MIESVSSPERATVEASSYPVLAPPIPPRNAGDSAPPAASSGESSKRTPAAAPAPPATRLYVERAAPDIYVYRLVDVASGRVIAELPRDRIADLDLSATYAPGALTSTSV